jgi:hypothetical protein
MPKEGTSSKARSPLVCKMDASNRFGAAASDGYVGATDLVGIMPPNGIETRAKAEHGSHCASITTIAYLGGTVRK